jgi:cell division protein FtsB
LAADVEDLKRGREAIEERARDELGMVASDEVFYQVVEGGTERAPAVPPERR